MTTVRIISRREILSALVDLHTGHGVPLVELQKALNAETKVLKTRISVSLSVLRQRKLVRPTAWGVWEITEDGIAFLLDEQGPRPPAPEKKPSVKSAPLAQPARLAPEDVDAIARRVVELLGERLHKPAAKPAPAAAPVKVAPTISAAINRMTRPSVLIVGLLGDQAHAVQTRYDRLLDISYIDSQHANPHTIRNACRHRDHIIQMTSFTAHTADSAIRCATGRAATRVNGSVSSLYRELDRIITQGSAPL